MDHLLSRESNYKRVFVYLVLRVVLNFSKYICILYILKEEDL